MTDAEISLWSRIRRKQLCGLQFYRQKPIENFIVDFYCPWAKLVIEIDGGQHYEAKGAFRDAIRDGHLKDLDLDVLRFSNLDVLGNMEGVIIMIAQYLEKVLEQKKTKSP